MKNILLLICFVAVVIDGIAQDSCGKYPKLCQAYSVEFLNQKLQNNSDLPNYLEYVANHSYVIERTDKNISDKQDIFDVELRSKVSGYDKSNRDEAYFNILAFDVSLTDRRQYFRYGNENKLMIILSKEEVVNQFNKSHKR